MNSIFLFVNLPPAVLATIAAIASGVVGFIYSKKLWISIIENFLVVQ